MLSIKKLFHPSKSSVIQSRFSKHEQKSFSRKHYLKFISKSSFSSSLRSKKEQNKKLNKFLDIIGSFTPEECSINDINMIETNFKKLMIFIYQSYNSKTNHSSYICTGDIKNIVNEFIYFILHTTKQTSYKWNNILHNLGEISITIKHLKYLENISEKIPVSPRIKKKIKQRNIIQIEDNTNGINDTNEYLHLLEDWTKNILEIRNNLIELIINEYKDSICWHKKYISFIILPIEQTLLYDNYEYIRIYYSQKYKDDDIKITTKLKEFATLTPAHLSVKEDLWLLPLQEGDDNDHFLTPPYLGAIQTLKNITMFKTPWEKLTILKKVVHFMHSSVLEYHQIQSGQNQFSNLDTITIGAEELLPLMMYVIIQSRLTCLYSESKFMEDFIPESELSRERGYYLITLQTVINAVNSLDFFEIASKVDEYNLPL